jgi:hypothetical protein
MEPKVFVDGVEYSYAEWQALNPEQSIEEKTAVRLRATELLDQELAATRKARVEAFVKVLPKITNKGAAELLDALGL